MGFLEVGEPLTWEEALKYIKFVRDHGIKQFINVFTRVKVRARDELLWGDEVGDTPLFLAPVRGCAIEAGSRAARAFPPRPTGRAEQWPWRARAHQSLP